MAERFLNFLSRNLDSEFAKRIMALEDNTTKVSMALENNTTKVSYGRLRLDAPPVAFPDIVTGVWQNVDVFDVWDPQGPGVIMDPNTGFFSVDHEAVYALLIVGTIEHDKKSGVQEMNLRLWDVDAQIQLGNIFPAPSGQNIGATLMSLSSITRVLASEINTNIVMQVSGGVGSTYTNVNFLGLNLSIFQVSNELAP